MDIYKDKPFRKNVYDFLSLVENNFENFSFTSQKVEIISDEIFARLEKIADEEQLKMILEWLLENKILLSYKIEKDKNFQGEFTFVSDVYILNINGEKMKFFLEDYKNDTDLIRFSNIKTKKLTRNGMILDLENGFLKYKNKISIGTNNSIILLAILMANKRLLTLDEIYQELKISPDRFEKDSMNGNLRRVKQGLGLLLIEIGFSKSDFKKMIKKRNKIGLIMKDIM